MADTAQNGNSFFDSVKTYLKGVKSEWGKITWPSKQQVIGETIQVIVITTIFTVLILSMDLIFQWMLSFIPKV